MSTLEESSGGMAFLTNAKTQRAVASMDALLCVARALNLVEGIASEETLKLVGRVAKARTENVPDAWSAASQAGLRLTRAANAALLRAHVDQWYKGGALKFAVAGDVMPAELLLDGGWPLSPAWNLLSALASIFLETDGVAERTQACSSLTDLAIGAEAKAALDVATACAVSATNFAHDPDPTSLNAIDVAIGLLIPSDQPDSLRGLRLRRAELLASLASNDQRWRLASFDAVEAVLWHLPSDDGLRDTTLAIIDRIIRQSPHLAGLLPLHVTTSPRALRDPSSKLPEAAWLFGSRVWEIGTDAIGAAVDVVSDIAIGQENARLELLPAESRGIAEASWSTWSFAHPSLSRAMPQFASLLRERDLDELILVVAHETTHVVSMLGGLSYAVLGLRTALLETELRLWAVYNDNRPVEVERVRALGVAPLARASILGLAQAEQALELALKLRILTRVWGPWLEGIAVFAETAGDPVLDPEISSNVAIVIANLIDVDVAAIAKQRGISVQDEFRLELEERESLWSSAIEREGPQRLWLQLVTYHERYLPGYLVVRSILSTWRRRYPPLPGPAALRILLHLTSFGTHDALPDFQLAAESFRAETLRKHFAWLDWIRELGGDTLEAFFENDTAILGWQDGQLVVNPNTDSAAILSRAVRQSLATLTNRADIDRVPGTDAKGRKMLRIVQKSLCQAKPAVPDSRLATSLGAALHVLPISQQSCQFWLHRTELRLLTLVRTTSLDRDRGRHLHYLTSTQLTTEEFAGLELEIQRRQESRLRVTRIVDLANSRPDSDAALFGSHYLTFSYGTWFKVTPAGMLAGVTHSNPATLEADARQRLADQSLLAFESKFTADGVKGAERTLAWLDTTSKSWDELGLPVDSWLDYVKQRAVAVAEGAETDPMRDLSEHLIRFALGHGPHVEALAIDGLRPLREVDSSWPAQIMRALDSTGRGPALDPWLDANSQRLKGTIGDLFSRASNGWDVTPAGEI
jgi:hypothetical protein